MTSCPSKNYRNRDCSFFWGLLAISLIRNIKPWSFTGISVLAALYQLMLFCPLPFHLSVSILTLEAIKGQETQDRLGFLVQQVLAFYTVLNSSRSFWQHSSDSIFVLATFEDLAATKQLSEFIHGSLKFLCRLVYWIKKIVMKDIFHSKSCDLKACSQILALLKRVLTL